MAGKGVREIVRKVMEGSAYLRKDGPTFYAKSGPWKAEIDASDRNRIVYALYHYGTKMLEWKIDDRNQVVITGWWKGWGSVSDQTGVNAALHELGSPMRYSRDKRGGGARVNPYRVGSTAVLRVATPPTY